MKGYVDVPQELLGRVPEENGTYFATVVKNNLMSRKNYVYDTLIMVGGVSPFKTLRAVRLPQLFPDTDIALDAADILWGPQLELPAITGITDG